MKNKQVISAVIGGAFFAIPYVGLSIGVLPALAIGATAFTASELVLSGVKEKSPLKISDKDTYKKVEAAKKHNEEILNLISKVENQKTKQNLSEIHDTVNKIIGTVEKHPKKVEKLDNFL